MITYGNLPPGPCKLADEHTVRKTYHTSHEETFEFMQGLCLHLIKRPDPLIVPVYKFEDLGKVKGYHAYSYDMMRCAVLPKEERNVVDAVGNARSRGYSQPTKVFTPTEDLDPYDCRDKYPELMKFLDQVIYLDRYHDLHSGNVMLNHDNEYCIIDLEGFTNSPLNLSENDWIIREQ